MNRENTKKTIRIVLYLMPVILLQVIFSVYSVIRYKQITVLILLTGVAIILVFETIFLFLNRRPFKYEQLVEASIAFTQKFFKGKYEFREKKTRRSNEIVYSNLTIGKWISSTTKVSDFSAVVSDILKGSSLPCLVIAVESNDIVNSFIIFKSLNHNIPDINYFLPNIEAMCKEQGSYTVLRFISFGSLDMQVSLNELRRKPDNYGSLMYSEFFSKRGINWIDFVWAQGDFFCFHRNISPYCQIPGNSASDYVDEIGISFWKDAVIRRKYIRTTKIYRMCRIIFFVGIASFLMFSWNVNFIYDIKAYSVNHSVSSAQVQETILETIEETTTVNENKKIVPVSIIDVSADSELVSKSGKDFSPQQMIDDDYTTCWQEGNPGNGTGETITLTFAEDKIHKVGIVNGNHSYDGAYNRNSRIAEANVKFYLKDVLVLNTTMLFEDDAEAGLEELNLNEPIECDHIEITIVSVYEGSNYSDMGVSEVVIYGEE